MAKTVEKKDKRLNDLIKELKGLNDDKTELMEENEEVFEKYTELEENIARVTDALKVEARLYIEEGDPTKVLYDDASMHVSVVQRPRPVSYDYEKARKYFPKEILAEATVRELDSKVIQKFIEKEELDEKVVDKVRVLGALPTAAVTVKFVR
jgi:hypothetical protein